jgi:hypothetical protein
VSGVANTALAGTLVNAAVIGNTNTALASFSSTTATGMAVITANNAANAAAIASGTVGGGGTGTGGGASQVQLDATTVVANNSVQYDADRSTAMVNGNLNVSGAIVGNSNVVSIGQNAIQMVSGSLTNGGVDRITTDAHSPGGVDLHLGGPTITNAGVQSPLPVINVQVDGNLIANKGITVAAGQVINAGGNKINHVADGVASTDAATVGQVSASSASAQTNAVIAANANTASVIAPIQKQLTGVQNQVNNLSSQVQANNQTALKGISGATAIAMMPPVAPGKLFAVGVGLGNFQGVSSIAIGVTANVYENITFRAAATNNSTVGVGAGWSF